MKNFFAPISFSEILVGILCLVVLAVWEFFLGIAALQRLVVPLTIPLSTQTVRLRHSLLLPFVPLSNWHTNQTQLQQLKAELAQAEGRLAQLDQLRAENDQLRELLENRHLQFASRHLARPIVSSIAPLVWLDEGNQVKPGWLVLYKDTILGQISSIEGQYARVALLTTSPDLRMLVRTEHGVTGLARSRNGRVVVTNIDPAAIVSIGERVTTVGQPGIPPGKFVGEVTEIEVAPNTANQTLVIDQLVSFYQTNVVEIEE